MDSNFKKILASVGGLLVIGAGFGSYVLGWWELPKKTEANAAEIKKVEARVDNTEDKLDRFVDASTAQLEAQKQLNVAQQALFQQQMQQQMVLIEKLADAGDDNGR